MNEKEIERQLKYFGENLEKLIKKKFHNIETFANYSGIPVATLYRYIRAETTPDLEKIIQIKTALGVSIIDMLEAIEKPSLIQSHTRFMKRVDRLLSFQPTRMDLAKYIDFLEYAIDEGLYDIDYHVTRINPLEPLEPPENQKSEK